MLGRGCGVLLLGGMVAASAAAQQPAPPAAPADEDASQQPTLQAALPLEGPTAMVFHVVKGDKAVEFEGLFTRLRAALDASPVAARRAQGNGWRLYKQNAPTAEGHLIYVSLIDPVVPGQEYDIARLLAEAYPDEGAALYQTLLATHVKPTVQASNLTAVTGAPATPDTAPVPDDPLPSPSDPPADASGRPAAPPPGEMPATARRPSEGPLP